MGTHFYRGDKVSVLNLRDAVREKRCPACHSTGSPLSAFLVITVKSFLLFTSNRKEIVVGCIPCIAASAKRANIISVLLGWWGFPLGPLSTIFALMHNWAVFDSSSFEEPDEDLMEYILALNVK